MAGGPVFLDSGGRRGVFGGGGAASITQTTDTLAVIEALTPALGDQGFPTDDPRLLIDQTDGAFTTYLPTPETLIDIDLTAATAYNFLTAGDGVHTPTGSGWTLTISGSAIMGTMEFGASGWDTQWNAGAGAVQAYFDPGQWETLTERDAIRWLIEVDTGLTSLGTNTQQVGMYTCANSGGAVATQPRVSGGIEVSGGTIKQRIGVYYTGWATLYKDTGLVQWWETIAYPRAVLTYAGANAGLPDLGTLTRTGLAASSNAIFATSEKVWDPRDTPLLQFSLVPQGAAYRCVIKRMVIQRIPGETP